ncbi:MAG: hypothetical protein RIB98_17630 [Acidimicrobiales bacterium]
MRSDPPDPPTPATVVDLQPARLVVLALLRWIWLIVSVCVATFLITAGITEEEPESAVAVARLGLTDEVVWPFYDAARDRVEILVTSDDFETRIEETIGAELAGIGVEVPINQAYIELVVEAETVSTATAGRDAAVEEVTAASLATRRVKLDQELSELAMDLAASEELIATLETQIDDVISRQVVIGLLLVDDPADPELRTEDRLLDSVRSRLITQRDGHVRTSQDLERDIDEVERAQASLQPEVELLRFSEAPSSDDSGFGPAAAATGLALIATSLAVVMWDRERGRIRHRWYLEGPLGLPVIGSLRVGESAGQAAAVDRLMTVVGSDAERIGIVAAGEVAAATVIADLVPVMTGTESGAESASGVAATSFVDLDSEYVDDDQVRSLTRGCDAIVMVCGSRQRVHQLRAVARRIRGAGGPLVGAILAAPES